MRFLRVLIEFSSPKIFSFKEMLNPTTAPTTTELRRRSEQEESEERERGLKSRKYKARIYVCWANFSSQKCGCNNFVKWVKCWIFILISLCHNFRVIKEQSRRGSTINKNNFMLSSCLRHLSDMLQHKFLAVVQEFSNTTQFDGERKKMKLSTWRYFNLKLWAWSVCD